MKITDLMFRGYEYAQINCGFLSILEIKSSYYSARDKKHRLIWYVSATHIGHSLCKATVSYIQRSSRKMTSSSAKCYTTTDFSYYYCY